MEVGVEVGVEVEVKWLTLAVESRLMWRMWDRDGHASSRLCCIHTVRAADSVVSIRIGVEGGVWDQDEHASRRFCGMSIRIGVDGGKEMSMTAESVVSIVGRALCPGVSVVGRQSSVVCRLSSVQGVEEWIIGVQAAGTDGPEEGRGLA